ncbi:MAG: contractile injection system tape measure protein [Bacteroidota bacterium]
MDEEIIIEKLVIDMEFFSEEEFYGLMAKIEGLLTDVLNQEWMERKPEMPKDISGKWVGENLLIEKLELDFILAKKEDLESTKLLHRLKSQIVQVLEKEIYLGTSSSKTINTSAFLSNQELTSVSVATPGLIQAQVTRRGTVSSPSKEVLIKYYLEKGLFFHGIKLSIQEIEEELKNPSVQQSIKDWFVKLNSPDQQIRVFKRIRTQFSKESTRRLLQAKVVNKILADFPEIFFNHKAVTKQDIIASKFTVNSDQNRISTDRDNEDSQDLEGLESTPTSKSPPNLLTSPTSSDGKPLGNPKHMQRDLEHARIDEKENHTNTEAAEKTQNLGKSSAKKKLSTLRKNHLEKPSSQKLDESIYVEYAGFVLLAPFLISLFSRVDLLNERRDAFANEESSYYAIHLLHYLSTQASLNSEGTTFLYKVICGLAIEDPLPLNIEISEEDKEAVNKLLLQVCRKWDIKLNEQINLLRGSFFFRNGKISRLGPQWSLTIENKLYDKFLLPKLPWSFRKIQLPWMNRILIVDWY